MDIWSPVERWKDGDQVEPDYVVLDKVPCRFLSLALGGVVDEPRQGIAVVFRFESLRIPISLRIKSTINIWMGDDR